MAEPMSDARLNRLAGLAELSCNCGLPDCEIYMSGLTRDQAQDLAAEAKRARAELAELHSKLATRGDLMNGLDAEMAELRALLGAPETVWGHQVHGDDGWLGEAVPHTSEVSARAVVHHMNTKAIKPDDRCRAKLVVHEVWHAETEWRVVEDGR